MSLLFIESFDDFFIANPTDFSIENTEDYVLRPDGAGTDPSVDRNGRRFSASSPFVNDWHYVSFWNTNANKYVAKWLSTPQDDIIVGMAMNWIDNLLARPSLTIEDSSFNQLAAMTLNADGSVNLISGGVTVTSSAGDMVIGTWNSWEMKYIKGTGADSVAELRKDGVVLLTITTGTETTQVHYVGYGRAHSTSHAGDEGVRQDDIYMLNSQGTTNNTYLGDVYVDRYVPSADGVQNDFFSSSENDNFTHVYIHDRDDGAFLENGAVDATELYPHNNIEAPATETFLPVAGLRDIGTQIFGVQHQLTHEKRPQNAGATAKVDFISEKTGGTGQKVNKNAQEVFNFDEPFHHDFSIMDVDPDNGTAWTDAAIAITQFGFKIDTFDE